MSIRKHKTKAFIEIDWDKVSNFIIGGMSGPQVAANLGIDIGTLLSACKREKQCEYSQYSASLRSRGDGLIHLKQFEKAMKGSDRMLTLLGQERLKQSEKITQTIETNQQITARVIIEGPNNGRDLPIE